jgi:hypothetical protein
MELTCSDLCKRDGGGVGFFRDDENLKVVERDDAVAIEGGGGVVRWSDDRDDVAVGLGGGVWRW